MDRKHFLHLVILTILVLGQIPISSMAAPQISEQQLRDAYAKLRLGDKGPSLPLNEVKARRNALMKELHPDKANGSHIPAAEVSHAYDVIVEARQQNLNNNSRSSKSGGAAWAYGAGPGLVPSGIHTFKISQVFENDHGYVFNAKLDTYNLSGWYWKPKGKNLVSRMVTTVGLIDNSGAKTRWKGTLWDPRLPNGQLTIEQLGEKFTIGEFTFDRVCERPCEDWSAQLMPEDTIVNFNLPPVDEWRSWNLHVYRGDDAYYVVADPQYFNGEWEDKIWYFRLFEIPFVDPAQIGEILLKRGQRMDLFEVVETGNWVGYDFGMEAVQKVALFDPALKVFLGHVEVQSKRERFKIYSAEKQVLRDFPSATAKEIESLDLIRLMRLYSNLPDKLNTPLDPRFSPFNASSLPPSKSCNEGLLGRPKIRTASGAIGIGSR